MDTLVRHWVEDMKGKKKRYHIANNLLYLDMLLIIQVSYTILKFMTPGFFFDLHAPYEAHEICSESVIFSKLFHGKKNLQCKDLNSMVMYLHRQTGYCGLTIGEHLLTHTSWWSRVFRGYGIGGVCEK